MCAADLHIEELALADDQLGAFFVAPAGAIVAVAHRLILIEAVVKVEDALLAGVVHQVDAETVAVLQRLALDDDALAGMKASAGYGSRQRN